MFGGCYHKSQGFGCQKPRVDAGLGVLGEWTCVQEVIHFFKYRWCNAHLAQNPSESSAQHVRCEKETGCAAAWGLQATLLGAFIVENH